ncbi:MAG: hypothetical protein ACOVQA_07600 [Thermoflexibacteraceae bacterium]|jgi:hypothetical protein
MKTHLFYLLFFIFSPQLVYNHHLGADVVLKGKWKGVLTQKANGIASSYPFELVVTEHSTQQKVKGFTIIRLHNEPQYYGKMTFAGDWNAKTQELQFTEIAIVEHHLKENMYWCIKNARLHYKLDLKATLKGDWWGCVPNSNIAEGQINLEKEIQK